MAASEVAVSLALVRLHDLLSKSENIIISKKLTDQISDSIDNLRRILKTRKQTELNDDQDQDSWGRKWAGEADEIAKDLVASFRDQMSKSRKGQFTKVFDLVQFFSVLNRESGRKKMAENLTEVGLLFSKFTSFRPSANEGKLDAERASSSSSSKSNRENMSQRVESDIVGRDKYVKKLLDWLIKNENTNLRVITVVGEQACGKTALVRRVFSLLEIKHHFDCRIWVRFTGLGKKSDWMKNLLVDILKQISLGDQAKDLEHKQEEQLFEILHKSLMGLRYLIVLDNLCESSLINELLVPFVDSMIGSRVIVTTPNAEMQKFADPWTPHLRLCPHLTWRECEELVRVSITRGSKSIDGDLEKKMTILKEELLSKYKFSPPVISLLGGLLSNVERSNCKALIKLVGDPPTLDKVMDVSFDQLPHMMKLCALYMTLFPEESEVSTRRLFRLWAAEGLSAEAADGSVPMLSAKDCLCELESRNLIRVVRWKLDGSARSCLMPSFIHHFFFQKAKKMGLLQIPYSSDSGFDAEQSAQNQQKQMQSTATRRDGYKVQYLQSFALFNTFKLGTKAKIADLLKSSSLKYLILLRVLDLEGVYKPVLPEKFGNTLTNLRYLGLRWTVLDFIPESVGNLLFLETLDLKHTNITKVTSSIWNLKNLQHLYLSEASFDKSLPGHHLSQKSPNTKLQTLWGLLIETGDSCMIKELENLICLKKLGVTCRPGAVKAVTNCVSKLNGLQSLRLRSRELYGQPLQALRLRSRDLFGQNVSLSLTDMKGFKSLLNLYLLGSLRPECELSPGCKLLSVLPKMLQALTLSMSGLEEDPMPVLGCLKDLIILRLLARSYTNATLTCDKAGFPKLRVLKLWMLENLETLEVKKGGMANLEELEIKHCERLTSIVGLHDINSLKRVSLSGVDLGRPAHVAVSPDTLVKPKELFMSIFRKPI